MTSAGRKQPSDPVRTYRFVARLPNKRSHRRLEQVLEQCRQLYNDGLTVKRMAYEWLGLTVVNGRTTVVRDRRRRVPRRLGADLRLRPRVRESDRVPDPVGDRIAGRLAVQLQAVGLDDAEIARRVGRGLVWTRAALEDPLNRDGRLAWTPEAVANLGFETHITAAADPWPVDPIDLRSCYIGKRGFNKDQLVPVSLSRWLTELQHTGAPELRDLERHVKVGVFNRLDRAMAHFFRRLQTPGQELPGFPSRLQPGEFRTIDLEVGSAGVNNREMLLLRTHVNRGKVLIKGLPPLHFRIDRELPKRAPNAIRVHRENGGRLWVMLVYRMPVPSTLGRAPNWRPAHPVGVHLNVLAGGELAVVTADGPIYNRYESRPPLHGPDLGRLRRRKRRAQDPAARARSMRALSRFFRRQAVATQGWQHRLSTGLVRQHDLVAVDNVDVVEAAGAVTTRRERTQLRDSGLGGIRRMLDYKGAEHMVEVVRVDAEDEHRRCSRCGHVNPETPGTVSPIFRCRSCSYMTRRDENAARNVLAAGLNQHRLETMGLR